MLRVDRFKALTSAGMHRKDHVEMCAQVGKCVEQAGEPGKIVHVGRTVQSDEDVGGRNIRGEFFFGAGEETDESVDHHVADPMDLCGGDAFVQEIFIAIGGWREEQVGKLIGDQAIDFFGHAAVVGAESGFDMANADAKLGTNESGREGGVDIAVDEDKIGLAVQQNGFESDHYRGSLLRVGAGADAQIAIRLRHFELPKENIGHGGVVMLAGVNQSLDNTRMGGESAQHGGRFHEIGTGANDVEDVHAGNRNKRFYPEWSEIELQLYSQYRSRRIRCIVRAL